MTLTSSRGKILRRKKGETLKSLADRQIKEFNFKIKNNKVKI